ncbi:phasin PhaH [Caulobacter hibisci]|uniref:Uncharacterized protein n=1 Tax=Caulobacter hibisci TaxID=2035993 RepID=A0ABS0SW43_9CAUL|nr:phasin PhaH [Caulobacter hibisci]MBI1683813.1 hypothetical protein [Caulobacter hibisci]
MASSSFLPLSSDSPETPSAPNLLLGAASPLWAVFGGAAAAGATWWWWANRWREAVNLEALIALAPEPVSRGALDAPAVLDTPAEVVEAAVAEVEPIVETVAASVVEVAEVAAEVPVAIAEASIEVLEAVVDIAPEPVAEAAAPVVEAAETVVAEVAEPVLETVVETVKTAADDLTLLVGIGPKLAASLADLGVTRFSQIADWSQDELDSFDKLLNLKGRAERDAWIAQAKRLAGGA